jgi:hypothetical protein
VASADIALENAAYDQYTQAPRHSTPMLVNYCQQISSSSL